MLFSHKWYPRVLLALLTAFAIALGISPHDRADWLLENALLFFGVGVLVFTHSAFPLSRVSYTLVFVFLCLHTIGAHYTYSLVPYDQWFPSLGGGRNHFDRLVHFCYGLLLAYPAREVFVRVADTRGFAQPRRSAPLIAAPRASARQATSHILDIRARE